MTAHTIHEKPYNSLIYVLALYMLIWPIVATLAHHSPPLDVIEGYVWGINPQWGYYKHPPLPAWITSAAINIFGKHVYILMLLGPVSILVSLVAVGWLAKELLSVKAAVVAIFITTTSLYFNFLIPEFNHNVVQIPLWASALALFWACINYGRYRHFVLLGIVLGLCLLAKYSAVILYAFILLTLITNKRARVHVTTGKFLVCALMLLTIISPNIYWLIQSDFQSLNYLGARLGQKLDWLGRLQSGIEFILAQLLANAVVLFLGIKLWRAHKNGLVKNYNWDENSKLLLASFIVPIALSIMVPLISGHPLRDMWAMMMFTTLGLGIVSLAPKYFERFYSKKWLIIWVVFQAFALLAYVGKTQLTPYVKGRISRATFPGPELAKVVEEDWNATTQGLPLLSLIVTGKQIGRAHV